MTGRHFRTSDHVGAEIKAAAHAIAPQIPDDAMYRTISSSNGYIGRISFDSRSYVLKLAFIDGTQTKGPLPQHLQIENEHHVLKSLGEPYSSRIVAYLKSDTVTGLLLHWTDGDSIANYVDRNRDPWNIDAIQSAYEACEAQLADLHGRGFAHGDVQPSHFRLSHFESTVKAEVIDYGIAGPIGSTYGAGLVHYLTPDSAQALLKSGACLRSELADNFALSASFASVALRTWVYDYEARGLARSELGPGFRQQKLAAIALGAPLEAVTALRGIGLDNIGTRLMAS